MDKLHQIHEKYGEWPKAVDFEDTGIKSDDLFNPELIETALKLASKNVRKRAIVRIHKSLKSELHLMDNAILGDSYVQPHMHTEKEKTETFRIVKGRAYVVFFDDQGQITGKVELNADDPDGRKVVSVRHNRWHTFVPMDNETVVLEAKRQPVGGYNADTDKTMAPWAPDGADEVAGAMYLADLKAKLDKS